MFAWPENWHTWYLEGVASASGLNFLKFWPQNPFLDKFRPKIQSCPFCLKISAHGILEELILHPDAVSQNSDRKIYFWANLGRKSQSCHFCLKIGTQSISKMLLPIPTLASWISNPKSIFWQVWDKKVKAVCFAWKFEHTVSRGYWFLFWD